MLSRIFAQVSRLTQRNLHLLIHSLVDLRVKLGNSGDRVPVLHRGLLTTNRALRRLPIKSSDRLTLFLQENRTDLPYSQLLYRVQFPFRDARTVSRDSATAFFDLLKTFSELFIGP